MQPRSQDIPAGEGWCISLRTEAPKSGTESRRKKGREPAGCGHSHTFRRPFVLFDGRSFSRSLVRVLFDDR